MIYVSSLDIDFQTYPLPLILARLLDFRKMPTHPIIKSLRLLGIEEYSIIAHNRFVTFYQNLWQFYVSYKKYSLVRTKEVEEFFL